MAMWIYYPDTSWMPLEIHYEKLTQKDKLRKACCLCEKELPYNKNTDIKYSQLRAIKWDVYHSENFVFSCHSQMNNEESCVFDYFPKQYDVNWT